MRRACQLALWFIVVVAAVVVPGRTQEVVDRMVAVVNKRVILESELDQARCVELLLQGRPLTKDKPGSQETQALLDRMIDRSLLEQQIADPKILDPTPEELAGRVKEIRSRIPGAAGEAEWKAMLSSYGLEQVDVEDHLISEFRILHFIDLRFRGLVHVNNAEISAYYQDRLLPELRRQSAPAPPLNQVSGKIETILIEQHMDEMLGEWLQTLRTQAHIEKLLSSGVTAGLAPGGGT
jgi:peptidyl-prolyl cis-trans isomerase SurA